MAVLNPQADIQALTNVSALADRRTKTAHLLHDTTGKPRRGVLSGFGGELAVTAPGGLAVAVASGCAILPAPQPGHGAWSLVNDAPLTLTLATAHPSNGRIDLIIARVADSFYYTGGDNLATIKVITGSASTSPTAPTVAASEGSYMVLAQVAVAAGATSISTANITKNTIANVPRTVALGGALPLATAAERNALTTSLPYGQVVFLYEDSAYYARHLTQGWLSFYFSTTVEAMIGAEGTARSSADGALGVRIDDLTNYASDTHATANNALAAAQNAQARLAAHGW